jgi:hypothetical protein
MRFYLQCSSLDGGVGKLSLAAPKQAGISRLARRLGAFGDGGREAQTE